MSLQVWLPLIGDTRNQGLGQYTITTLGTLSWVTGKLGATAMRAGNGTQIVNGLQVNTNFTNLLNNDHSISVWVKPYGNHIHYNGSIMSSGNWNTANKRWAFGVSQDNSKVDVLCMNYNTYITCDVPVNEWTNLICVRQGTTVKLYKNGSYIGSRDCSTDPSFDSDANVTCIGRESYANGYFSFNGAIQDLRLYSHALSEMEIKELAKGLILHYSLSDKYAESTTNLITTEDCLSSTCYNGATSKYNYGTTTNMYKTVTTYDGRKGTKVYAGADGTGFWPYVYINNMYTSNGTNSPAYKTLSFDYYTTISTAIYPYKLGSGSGTATYKVSNSSGIKTGMGTDSVVIPVVPNEWNHVEITFHGTTDADAQWGYIRNNPSHTSNTSNFWFFANMQLEVKDHATGYAGVNGSRTATTFYDSSGFCNNGTISGAFTISNDTPKYIVSQNCTGTNYISLPPPSTEVKTISVWANWKTIPSGQSVIFVDYGSGIGLGLMSKGILCSTSGAGNSYTYSKSSLVANTWYHFVIVKTGTTTRKLYINGVEQTATSNASNWTYAVNELQIGKRSTTSDGFVGKLSDFRAYTTELSDDDIKALYEDKGYIDNKGNVYGTLYEI